VKVETLAPDRRETTLRPGLAGFLAFCELIDHPLEPYQRRIARAFFGRAREVAAILPRGNAKTTMAALLGLHHLATTKSASVVIGAASVQQARICFERMEGFIAHPELEGRVTLRHLELRFEGDEGLRRLRVVPSDGPRTHGLSCTLYIADELWAWSERADLLTAMQTGLVKRSDAKLLMITTATADLDSPLGRLRQRAMSQSNVHRAGPVVESKGSDLHWLEWSLGEQHELDNLRAVKRCNPAPWISVGDLRRQKESVTEAAFAQFHACRWGRQTSSWLPSGAWAACADPNLTIERGEVVYGGVDIGGSRAASALVLVTEDLRVAVEVYEGDEAVLEVAERLATVARYYTIREVCYDPWRFRSEALRLEDAGLKMTEFPQTSARMCPATERLFAAIVEKRLRHPDDEQLNRHISNTVAKETPRGFRIGAANDTDRIDAAIALAMAVDAQSAPQPAPTKFLGWL
jgi:phage terminase large subunit-like protein